MKRFYVATGAIIVVVFGIIVGAYYWENTKDTFIGNQPAAAGSALCVDCIDITVGRPLVVRGPSADELDTYVSLIKLPNNTYRAFIANSTSYFVDTVAPWSMAAKRQISLQKGARNTLAECGRWLSDTELLGNTLLGLVHQEQRCNYDNGQTHKTTAITQSNDFGKTWGEQTTFTVVDDVPTRNKLTGIGDCSLLRINEELYAYCLRARDWRTVVYKAPINNQVSRLAGGRNTPVSLNWSVWDGATWKPAAEAKPAALGNEFGASAAFWEPYKVPILATIDPWNGGLTMSFGTSPTSFTKLMTPLLTHEVAEWNRPAKTELISYPSIIDSKNASDDITKQFLLVYTYIPPGEGFDKRYLVMQDVTIEMRSRPLRTPQVKAALSEWGITGTERKRISSGPVISGAAFKKTLGYLLTKAPKDGSKVERLVECVSYWPGHADYMLTNAGTCNEQNGYRELRTAGWVYKDKVANSVPVYRCWNDTNKYHFAATSENCDGQGRSEWRLGYLLK